MAHACPVLTAAVEHHAAVLDLDVQSTAQGLWLRHKPSAPQTVLDALRRRHPGPAAGAGRTLGVVARALALHSINPEGEHSEGAQAVDLEVLSHPNWVRWKRSLGFPQSSFLRVWTSGAVQTRTRRCLCPVSAAAVLHSRRPGTCLLSASFSMLSGRV